ncbi:thymidylate synthase [Acinetobacter baumannii]|uniref:thymidylate synthase n=1 Tax=Acinetobacter baumannii TaxID=470 RepID=UPI001BC8753B|nr:thymidylate synthase [Acinetobacter baumannii]MDC4661969.1 thymidylate synthase [Acinetobacter baumannii]MDC4675687.1 thymidylate synthase [Acinetobacter baumannii]MDC4719013.1 thymidylate synthase [Acinetobacter baumannii]MDC4831864.1 thymidylate synthase [Acinetobacter baumannii]
MLIIKFMLIFNDSFNISYFKAFQAAQLVSEIEVTRNGNAKVLGQATFRIQPHDPRLCFLKGRNLNYKFAFVESAWILEGRNDLDILSKYISSYSQYSDDNKTLNGAYGYRLRYYFNQDQIEGAICHLQKNPESRRVVLQIYSVDDLQKNSKDIPCNTNLYLKVSNNSLDLTVVNRSNDLYLGIPYNIFVFGILQKYIAHRLDLRVGIQTQITDNLHLYEKDFKKVTKVLEWNSISDIKKLEFEFDWNYSDSIIKNQVSLLENLNEIEDPWLKAIMNHTQSPFQRGPKFLEYIHSQICVKVAQNPIKTEDKMSEAYDWQKISMASSSELRDFIESNKHKFETIKDQLKSTINQNDTFFALKDDLKDDVLVASIILSCAWYSLDPFIINSPLGQQIKQNYESVCNDYGLSLKSLHSNLGSETVKKVIEKSLI